eukprot:gene36346-biopygen3088
MGTSRRLNSLTLDNNCLSSTIPAALGNLKGLIQLTTDGDWTAHYTVPRCPDYQDVAMSDLNTYLSVAATFSKAISTRESPWTGVTCSGGLVVGLNLRAVGVKGKLPTSLGVLSGLTSLILSSNGISGSIVPELSHLTNLNTLEVDSNHISGTVPSALSRLAALSYLDLSYNQLSQSVPTFFAIMENLLVLYADRNTFGGELLPDLCEAIVDRNLTLTLTSNPHLSCYQPQCWSTLRSVERHLDQSLRECVPTAAPTSPPTTIPTVFPTLISLSTTQTLSSTSVTVIVVLVVVFVVVVAAYLIYRYRFSERARKMRIRMERLAVLPVHRFLLGVEKADRRKLRDMILANMDTVNERDANGNSALQIILNHKNRVPVDTDELVLLLETTLPVDPVSGEQTPDNENRYGWVEAVQHNDDLIVEAVKVLLDKYPHRVLDLKDAVDDKGRSCLDIASPVCKILMLKKLYLHGRYEVRAGPPEHRSATSSVFIALDHADFATDHFDSASVAGSNLDDSVGDLDGHNCCASVAMKFMKNRDQFDREVSVRANCKFDSRYVLDCLRSYDGDSQDAENVAFRKDAILKGYEEYPYCVVMEAGTMSLKHLIDKQNIAGQDWDAIRNLTKQVAKAVQHVHDRGIIHGDIKALNILQVSHTLKLIDFDGSSSFKNSEYDGLKYSSACLPPEMFWKGADGVV